VEFKQGDCQFKRSPVKFLTVQAGSENLLEPPGDCAADRWL